MEFLGKCFGVRLEPSDDYDPVNGSLGPNTGEMQFIILVEDDENWHEQTTSGSVAWLDDLIDVLQAAKAYCQTQEPYIVDGKQYGWKFKS